MTTVGVARTQPLVALRSTARSPRSRSADGPLNLVTRDLLRALNRALDDVAAHAPTCAA